MSAQEARNNVLESVRKSTKEQLTEKVAKTMHKHIIQQIKTSISEQVKVELGIQIHQHLPESLEQQVKEGREQIEGIKAAFHNSEARRANALLRTDRLDDRLEKVYKPDHTESSRYPTNLRSLFAYTAGQAQALAQDYELTATGSREEIINRFMTHIGVLFPLLWMSLGAEE
ncbi:hypothetical protein C8Q72DRAFT_882216 [Fomitopsis betulina]|nr:hypothetical protein C8Q72DRAFT_882216 [Fomitopsis betulina]